MPTGRTLVTVVTPFFNARDSLPDLVACLAAQTFDPERFEVVLVDDASTDGSAGRIEDEARTRAAGLALRVVRRRTGGGSYAARNDALAVARGRVLAFTDADCRPDPGWLARGYGAVETTPRVAGRIVVSPSSARRLAEVVDASRFLRQDRYVREGFGATANLFVRREVFDAVGPFDARLRSGGDYEHGRRATRAGFPIALAEDAVVVHPCRSTYGELFRKAERVGFGVGQLMRIDGTGARALGERALDRLSLARGRAADARGFDVSPGERGVLAAAHVALAAATAVGVARGYVTTAR